MIQTLDPYFTIKFAERLLKSAKLLWGIEDKFLSRGTKLAAGRSSSSYSEHTGTRSIYNRRVSLKLHRGLSFTHIERC